MIKIFREEATSALAVFYVGPLSWLNWNLEMLVLRMEKNQRTRIKDLGAR